MLFHLWPDFQRWNHNRLLFFPFWKMRELGWACPLLNPLLKEGLKLWSDRLFLTQAKEWDDRDPANEWQRCVFIRFLKMGEAANIHVLAVVDSCKIIALWISENNLPCLCSLHSNLTLFKSRFVKQGNIKIWKCLMLQQLCAECWDACKCIPLHFLVACVFSHSEGCLAYRRHQNKFT